jgi:hypothetical protein
MEVIDYFPAPAALTQQKELKVPYMDAVARRKKFLAPAGNQIPVVQTIGS